MLARGTNHRCSVDASASIANLLLAENESCRTTACGRRPREQVSTFESDSAETLSVPERIAAGEIGTPGVKMQDEGLMIVV